MNLLKSFLISVIFNDNFVIYNNKMNGHFVVIGNSSEIVQFNVQLHNLFIVSCPEFRTLHKTWNHNCKTNELGSYCSAQDIRK